MLLDSPLRGGGVGGGGCEFKPAISYHQTSPLPSGEHACRRVALEVCKNRIMTRCCKGDPYDRPRAATRATPRKRFRHAFPSPSGVERRDNSSLPLARPFGVALAGC